MRPVAMSTLTTTTILFLCDINVTRDSSLKIKPSTLPSEEGGEVVGGRTSTLISFLYDVSDAPGSHVNFNLYHYPIPLLHQRYYRQLI